jgi:hypothetical protein
VFTPSNEEEDVHKFNKIIFKLSNLIEDGPSHFWVSLHELRGIQPITPRDFYMAVPEFRASLHIISDRLKGERIRP